MAIAYSRYTCATSCEHQPLSTRDEEALIVELAEDKGIGEASTYSCSNLSLETLALIVELVEDKDFEKLLHIPVQISA